MLLCCVIESSNFVVLSASQQPLELCFPRKYIMRLKWFVVRIKLGAEVCVVRRKVTAQRLFSTPDSSAERSGEVLHRFSVELVVEYRIVVSLFVCLFGVNYKAEQEEKHM